MKTLLIPTDFSKNADHAARYGLSTAQKTNATVILLNSYELPYADTVMTTSLLEVMRKNSNEQLEALKKKYNAEFPDVDIDIMSSMNNSIRAIKTHAERLQVDLVVMGTKGATGLQEVLIGSTTASVLSGNVCPVLAIPQNAEMSSMEHAAFFIDGRIGKNDGRALAFLSSFLTVMGASLNVVHVYDEVEEIIEEPALLNEHLTTPYTFGNVYATEVEEGIAKYIDEHDIHLAVMLKRKYTFIERLFHRSQTASMANHSHIPLLAIQE